MSKIFSCVQVSGSHVDGSAENEASEMLPSPFAVEKHFIGLIEKMKKPFLLPEATAQVSFDYDTGRITTFLCSVQCKECASPDNLRSVIIPLMNIAAMYYNLNTDFTKVIVPTDRAASIHIEENHP